MTLTERMLLKLAAELLRLEDEMHSEMLLKSECFQIIKDVEEVVEDIQSNEALCPFIPVSSSILYELDRFKMGEMTRYEFSLRPLYKAIILYLDETELLS